MHGTGTQAGDTQEIQSVSDVLAPSTVAKRRSSKQPVYIGAVKSNVGHGEAVAGSTALLKVLLMFDKQTIPRHVGIKNTINPAFPKDLDKRQLRIAFENTPWLRAPERKRIAVLNNFSAAGGNTSIVLQEPPVRETPGSDSVMDPRLATVVAVSAKSKASLKGNIQRLLSYLKGHPDVSLADLGYTTTARRHHHNHRIAIATATSDHGSLTKQLNAHLASIEAGTHNPIPSTGAPPVVFAFTGQGASHRSMNLELFHNAPTFRAVVLHLDALCTAQDLPSFLPAIDGSHPSDHAHSPAVTQLALVCTEIALARYWESLGVRPDAVIGHSLGEYAALHVAGVLSATDAVFLVGQRALMLERECQAGSHKMLAVRASIDEIKAAAGTLAFEVACLNGPQDTALSGTCEEIAAVRGKLQAAGFKCVDLDVAFAFHSAQTDPVLDELEETARTGVLFQPPQLPIISPLLGRVVFDEKTINANYIRRATREPVDFLAAVETAHRMAIVDGTSVWIEMGPHPVCMGFARSIGPTNLAVPSLRRGEDNWTTMAQSLAAIHTAGLGVGWNEFHRPFESGLRLLDLPTYAWNDKTHWIMYNGDWALTKGNTFYDEEKKAAVAAISNPLALPRATLRTSLVHRVVEETFNGAAGRVVVQSDMMESDFLAAAWGHKMNGAGVVTSVSTAVYPTIIHIETTQLIGPTNLQSIHADIAWTLASHLFDNLRPDSKRTAADIDLRDVVVRQGLVAQKNTAVPQLIQVSISTSDIDTGVAQLAWHNVTNDGAALVDKEPVVTCQVVYGDSAEWLASWTPMLHLVQGRIESLTRMADEGVASRLSHGMAYLLFAANLVDYADKYRGMQSVVLHGLEAYADVTLKSGDTSGSWTVPPFFLDSVFHLGGFVLNASDAMDTQNNFCVTPGWKSLRVARPLVAGSRYRSYVKMIPTMEDPTIYLGDVYVLQDDEIIGFMQAMKFRRYPRVLLSRLFSAPEVKNPASGTRTGTGTTLTKTATIQPPNTVPTLPKVVPAAEPVIIKDQLNPAEGPETATKTAAAAPPPAPAPAPAPAPVQTTSDSITDKALALVVTESGIDAAELQDHASFANLGIDSLMSLVIAERLREQLGIIVNGSLFVEYPTVGDLRAWLVEYYN